MKRVLFLALCLVSFGVLADAAVVTEQIIAPAGATGHAETALAQGELEAVKLCEAFDAPGKHTEVKAFIYPSAESEAVWFGDVSKGCTGLDVIPVKIDLSEGANIKFDCRNFDAVERTCRVKAVVYTK